MLTAGGLRAEEEQACVTAYDESQRARRSGQLLRTRELLLSCAQESCPAPIVKACTRWLADVTASIPTLVVGAKDAEGRDSIDVRVFDGQVVLADRLDGRAVMLDPGAHELRFVFPNGSVVVERVLVRESEKNRVVTAQLPGPKKALARKQPRAVQNGTRGDHQETTPGPPVVTIVLGAVGAVALASFGYFGIGAQREADHLDATCAPNCPRSDTDAIKNKALIADISLGVGLASFAGATYFWVTAAPGASTAGTGVTSVGVAGRF